MERDMYDYCKRNRVENESDFIRHAIARFLEADYDDKTLLLSELKNLRRDTQNLRDMVQVIFSYLRKTHVNLLAYHPEIEAGFADAALKSAAARHDKFFSAFKNGLRQEPSFFEGLLHSFVSGDLDGTV